MFANNKMIIPNPENGAKVKLSTHLYGSSIQFYWKAILQMSQNTILRLPKKSCLPLKKSNSALLTIWFWIECSELKRYDTITVYRF